MDVNLALGVNSGNNRRANRHGSLVRRRSSQRFVEPEFEPKIEWVDTSEAHILVADLPGFKKDGVKVHIDLWGNIIISGERRVEELVFVGGVWHPRERAGYQFKKVFSVPENADTGGITVRFENEMLYVTINKLKTPPEIRSINISDQESKSIPQVGESSGKVAGEFGEKKDDNASSNKTDQDETLRNEKAETPRVANPSAAQEIRSTPPKIRSINISDQESKSIPQVGESSGKVAEEFGEKKNDNASSNKTDQDESPRNEKAETPQVAKPSAAQETAQMKETRLEATNKPEEMAKHPPLLNKDSITLQEQFELSDSMESMKKEAEIRADDQHELKESKLEEAEIKPSDQREENLVQKPTVESSPPAGDQNILHPSHEDQINEVEIGGQKANEGDDCSSGSDVEEHECGEEKHLPKVSQFMLSRRDVLVASAIVLFSLTLYFTYTLRYLDD